MPGATFANPLPGVVLGDPFVLPWRGQFYLFGTNDGPPLPDGRAIPVFRSEDLIGWEPLGGALEPAEPGADHWAPEVLAWNGRFYMVVSFGDVERVGHALWVAVADRPEGPYRLERRISEPSEAFSIDGAWLLDDDGRLYLYRCLDFVEEGAPPHGTGIVVQPMRDPLTPAGPSRTVLRAHAPWHLFEASRVMPLYEGRTFAEWTTIEGPAPVRRAGRVFCGYSGGNYQFAYGTGEAVADDPLGPYHDPRGALGPLFATTPGLVDGPGHFSVVRPDLIHDWIVLHGRRPGESGRRVWLCPARWDRDGVQIGPLTDQPQPTPPLPPYRSRFDASRGRLPDEWEVAASSWSAEPEGLIHLGHGEGLAWVSRPFLEGDWSAEVFVRCKEQGSAAGIEIGSGDRRASAVIAGDRVEVRDADGRGRSIPAPSLGDLAFDPRAFHVLRVATASGRAELRCDGVVLARDWALPHGPSRLGLVAREAAVFDAVAAQLGGPAST
jgi:GH43 family beta-xylosidase